MNENAKNPASVSKLFKEIGASKCKTVQIFPPLKINDCIIENSKDIDNEFNNIFCKCSIKNQRANWDF